MHLRRIKKLWRAPETETLDPDALTMSESGPAYSRMVDRAVLVNRRYLKTRWGNAFALARNTTDDLAVILARYANVAHVLPEVVPNPSHDVILLCVMNAQLSLYTAQRLTADGLYGPARPHLRQTFEALMIAKYCSVNHSSEVFDRWIDGLEVYFSNAILKKIVKPDTAEFRLAWELLCNWSHASVYSGQFSMRREETAKQALWNLMFIMVFANWMYHLINRHLVTPSIRYYGDAYAITKKADRAKSRLLLALPHGRRLFGVGAKRLVRDFRASWTIRT